MASEPSSRAARAAAEHALGRLLVELGTRRDELVIIGGLNPDLLTHEPPAPHQGTTDVDVLVSVGFAYERDELDFSWLEEALRAAGFEIDPLTASGWRWTVISDDRLVKLELLCDVRGDQRNHAIALPGCDQSSAWNIQGPRAVLDDTVWRSIALPDQLGAGAVQARFAGLGGFVLAKSAAVVRRGEDRDFYDLVFVLLYNTAGGPRAAAQELVRGRAAVHLADYRTELRLALSSFVGGSRDGAFVFAEQMRSGDDEAAFERLVEDATGAAMEFWDELARRTGWDEPLTVSARPPAQPG